jgi:hypothetical protein
MARAVSGGSEAGAPVVEPARRVDLASIERELAALWDAGEGQPVTRACISNLLVYCGSQAEAERIPEEIAGIVERYPSRVLLLVGEQGASGEPVETFVSAVCHRADARRKICSEHVTVSADRKVVHRLPSIARALLIGDLPTALWWVATEPGPLARGLFFELAAMAHDQIVYDSRGWPDPVRGVIALADWAEQDQAARKKISDLAWRVLKPWRRLIGQSLDPELVPGALENLREITIEHGPHALPQAWLLIGWLAVRLGWKPEEGKVEPGREVDWGFESASGPVKVRVRRLSEGDPEVRSLVSVWRTGGREQAMRFSVGAPGMLEAHAEGSADPPRVISTPSHRRADLVAAQLPKRHRDATLHETLRISRTMAEALAR